MHAQLGDRSLFPDLRAGAYLAHAAISPLSLPVAESLRAGVALGETGGLAAFPHLIERADAARDGFARLIGARPGEVARVSSTSAGVSAIASALALRSGDRVVLFEGEFPTNVTPWQAAARARGAQVVFVPLAPFQRSLKEGLAALDAELARGCALVAVSAVQFQTGLAMPLAEIAERAHAVGARVFVDGIQAVGATPLDVVATGIDFLACASHKWLMGPMGAGFLFVAQAARAELEPLSVGWVSHVDFDAFLFGPGELRYDRPLSSDARVFEQGVHNFLGLCGLAASIELLEGLGAEAIWNHVQAYLDRVEPELVARGWRSLRHAEPAGRSTIASFAPPAGVDTQHVVESLGEAGVAVTGPDGLLRIAPHWPNASAELELLTAALDRI
ncbi:aminotransferase class V-fold PLP-dependent enzyme [Engelhardtia mirabilis]